MTEKKNIAIFASGSGSNFQAIAESIVRKEINANISLLVCDNPNAIVLERSKKFCIDFFVCSPKNFNNKQSYEEAILHKLKEYQIDFIALSGYMRIIGKTLLNHYEGRMVNIHPSLLPSFPGATAIKDAFDYGVKVSGVTIHWVDSGIDTGKIISQKAVYLDCNDTLESFSQKIHAVEHILYSETLSKLL